MRKKVFVNSEYLHDHMYGKVNIIVKCKIFVTCLKLNRHLQNKECLSDHRYKTTDMAAE